jgi:hypothetical protein
MSAKRKATSSTRRGKRRTVRRNPSDSRLLATAQRLSRRFHGRGDQVLELAPSERQGRSRFAVLVGRLEALTYEPPGGSRRGGTSWTHASGDRGGGKPSARHRPLLVVDPKTRRPFLLFGRSPLRFSSARGLVG